MGLTLMSISPGHSKAEESKFSLVIIVLGVLFAYYHLKNKRRISILELEVLKLKRRVFESEK